MVFESLWTVCCSSENRNDIQLSLVERVEERHGNYSQDETLKDPSLCSAEGQVQEIPMTYSVDELHVLQDGTCSLWRTNFDPASLANKELKGPLLVKRGTYRTQKKGGILATWEDGTVEYFEGTSFSEA